VSNASFWFGVVCKCTWGRFYMVRIRRCSDNRFVLIIRSCECGVWFAEACKTEDRQQFQGITDSSDEDRPRKRSRKSRDYHTIPLPGDEGRSELLAIKNVRVPNSSAAGSSTSLRAGDNDKVVTVNGRRVYQACIPCRRRKVKCDLGSVHNPSDPPCMRCRRESRE
jgi:hypothetical protein